MSRRKGTPCACECDPCKGKNYVRAVNNVSPDANGDFEILAGNGIGISQSGDNSITIINQAMASSFVAGDNIEINPSGNDLEIRVTDDISVQDISVQDIDASGDVNIGGTLNVAGDIIQQGAAYETHAEKIYTTNDYIYMRDGAVGGLAVGAFSGFQVEKYDGTNDGRLVIDNSGVARVGDVGDEQPLMTRDESADLSDSELLQWDAMGQKAVGSGQSVGGLQTAIDGKQNTLTPSVVINASRDTSNTSSGTVKYTTYGKIVVGTFDLAITNTSTWNSFIIGYGLPNASLCNLIQFATDTSPQSEGWCSVNTNGQLYLTARGTAFNNQNIRGTFVYIAQ